MRKIISIFLMITLLCLQITSCKAKMPYIGENGNWWFDGEDLGFPSQSDSSLKDTQDFTLAFWNIGHFSNGSKQSAIKQESYDSKLAEYRDFIYNEIDADILCLAEYSRHFGESDLGVTRSAEVLFNEFDFKFEGAQRNYVCNALFSNVAVLDKSVKEYDCNQDAVITHTTLITAEDYYYIDSDIYANGEVIKLVSVHLAFDRNKTPDTINQNQIYELIEKYQYHDKVIFIGDFNCQSFDYFNIFSENGYSLGNNFASAVTLPASSRSIDNMVYKGVSITDFKIHATELSDHYAISCTVKTNLKDYDASASTYSIDPATLESCGYTIVTANLENNGSWFKSKTYFGSIIDLAHIPYDFDYVVMENLTPQTSVLTAFLTELPIEGKYPSYAANTAYVDSKNSEIKLEIPKDARYLFIYHTSAAGSEQEKHYLPESITFTKE